MKISEIITDKYKLRISPTVYYDLLADVREVEEEQEPIKGHWIYKEFDERTGITNVHICSKCGCPLASPYKSFCSACGSDNREVKE